MLPERRAKIVCTIGPSCRSPERLEQLIAAGMDLARLNFSHGSHDDHAAAIRDVREAAKRCGKTVGLLQDLQGPKIRIGNLAGGPVELVSGSTVALTTREVPGTSELLPTDYEELPRDVQAGATILIDDGLLELRVIEVGPEDVRCLVIDGGIVKSRKGINLPGTEVSAPSLTDKDRQDLAFGLEQGVDYVALSFVRTARDVEDLRKVMVELGRRAPVIAKLEKPEAVDRIDEILEVVDGVMIARGDMGVELPPEQVPVVQKMIIERAHLRRVPVITATQMLESMTANPRPTRAEVSDVANAIFDGTDATMLSGETASGEYPVEAVKMMDRIARNAEANSRYRETWREEHEETASSIAEATCLAACRAADAVGSRLIVVFTRSGLTARYVSKLKPSQRILAFSPSPSVQGRLALFWGVTPCYMDAMESTDALIQALDRILLAEGFAGKGEPIAIVMGSPLTEGGTTNLFKLHRVGELSGEGG